jgi:hypothetical protein
MSAEHATVTPSTRNCWHVHVVDATGNVVLDVP